MPKVNLRLGKSPKSMIFTLENIYIFQIVNICQKSRKENKTFDTFQYSTFGL